MLISYDAGTCQIWLDDIGNGPASAQPLCPSHAARLKPPQGWVVVDRRREPSRFRARVARQPISSDIDSVESSRPVRRQWGRFEPAAVGFAEPEAVAAPASDVAELVPLHMTDAFASLMREAVVTAPSPDDAPPVNWGAPDVPVVDPAPTPPPVPEPEPAIPTPVVPEPALPDPVVPEPEPVVPQPVVPEPIVPDPIVPDPTVPDPQPDVPDPITPDPTVPEPVVPDQMAARTATRRDRSNDEPPVMKPKGRLLSRAFEATGHQRTVLSEPLGRSSLIPTSDAAEPAAQPAAESSSDPTADADSDSSQREG